jgi:hypothetical protein
VFTAGELIEILQVRYRRRFPVHADRPFGAFPPTWRAWFLSIQERLGAVTGAPAADYLDVLLLRPECSPPKASPELSRWRAYASLGRQQWEPAPRDQRWMRSVAGLVSGLLHVVFMVMLLWLGFVAIGDAPPDAPQAGETVLIEYIGTGTPVEQGGAAAPGEVEAPAASAAPAPAQISPARTADAASPPPSASAATQPPASEQPPQPAEAGSAQPLVVTETAQADIDFTLPAPVPRDANLPQFQVTVPQVSSSVVEIETFEPRPTVRAVERPALRVPTPTVPALRTEVTEVEVRRPTAEVQVRPLSQTPLRTPDIRVPTLRTTPTEVPMRAPPAPAATAATAAPGPAATPKPPATVPGNATATAGRSTAPATATATPAGGQPQAAGAGRSTTTASKGAGPAPSPRPGAAPSTTRSDDWGDSNRNVPGNSATAGRGPGLFNSDGGIRLPGDGGRVGGGLPPGTIIEDFQKIDRMGTWLKRPPLDYTPTRFDKFWVPNRSLLEEWVSRGIQKVAIPIPGTTKRIECTVSLLQVGGGCTIYDPNLQDQEAIARPPPDVPFKPELQEDKDSLKK